MGGYRFGKFDTRQEAKEFCLKFGVDVKRIARMGKAYTIITACSGPMHAKVMHYYGLFNVDYWMLVGKSWRDIAPVKSHVLSMY